MHNSAATNIPDADAAREVAITFTARGRVELLPAQPNAEPLGPREIAGRTLASLVSAGTEGATLDKKSGFPLVPGYAAVFEVESVGAEVDDIRAGDRALCMGPHRSWQRVAREEALLLPAGLAPETAVFARLMGVGMSTLTTTVARPPQKVLIMGLGLVGHLAAQVFAGCGYEVLACDPVESRRALAARVGVEARSEVPLHDSDWAGHIALALECSGHEAAALDACRMVRPRGEVVLVGTSWRRRSEMFAHELLHAIFHRYVVLRSGWEWEVPLHPTGFRSGSIWGNLAAALRWLAEGRVKVEGLAALAAPAQAQNVYHDLQHARWPALAAVFDWTQ